MIMLNNDYSMWDYEDPEPERKLTPSQLKRRIKQLEARIEKMRFYLYKERQIVNIQKACLADQRQVIKEANRRWTATRKLLKKALDTVDGRAP